MTLVERDNPQLSSLIGIDGKLLPSSVDDSLKSLWLGPQPICRWCGKDVHADSFQFVGYNGGVLTTRVPYGHPARSRHAAGKSWEFELPHLYCGCSDACLARDLAYSLAKLEESGVLDSDGSDTA